MSRALPKMRADTSIWRIKAHSGCHLTPPPHHSGSHPKEGADIVFCLKISIPFRSDPWRYVRRNMHVDSRCVVLYLPTIFATRREDLFLLLPMDDDLFGQSETFNWKERLFKSDASPSPSNDSIPLPWCIHRTVYITPWPSSRSWTKTIKRVQNFSPDLEVILESCPES